MDVHIWLFYLIFQKKNCLFQIWNFSQFKIENKSIVLLFHGLHPNNLRLLFYFLFLAATSSFIRGSFRPSVCVCVSVCVSVCNILWDILCKRRLQLKIAGLRNSKFWFKISNLIIIMIRDHDSDSWSWYGFMRMLWIHDHDHDQSVTFCGNC